MYFDKYKWSILGDLDYLIAKVSFHSHKAVSGTHPTNLWFTQWCHAPTWTSEKLQYLPANRSYQSTPCVTSKGNDLCKYQTRQIFSFKRWGWTDYISRSSSVKSYVIKTHPDHEWSGLGVLSLMKPGKIFIQNGKQQRGYLHEIYQEIKCNVPDCSPCSTFHTNLHKL